MMSTNELTGLEIAVIGIDGRFPGANNIYEFWNNLKNGVESISFFSKDELNSIDIDPKIKYHSQFVNSKGGVLRNKEFFDSDFFRYDSNEAKAMNPQIRILHESVWHTLEDAGYYSETFNGLIGLYVGSSSDFEWKAKSILYNKKSGLESFFNDLFIERDYLTTRISYSLNLKGPSVLVQSTCSSSLVAIHMACRALLTGECDMALAGGISLNIINSKGYIYKEGMVLSSDGHCRAFDKHANGIAIGEGVGIVLLKKLSHAIIDRDNIYAVIKGSAINNDGNRKVGYTAPSILGQKSVIEAALKFAEVSSDSISYVETHGTGTKLGDLVEIEALKQAFSTKKKSFCGLGSVKTNVGHMNTASGVGSFIKVVLSLNHKLIPPSLNFKEPNPKFEIDNSPFYINSKLKNWTSEGFPLRAGVSSFGIGGTNAHIILEEAPKIEVVSNEKEYKLLMLSAKNEDSLTESINNLKDFLKQNQAVNISDLAYTLQIGRQAFLHRAVLVCKDLQDVLEIMQSNEKVGFIKKSISGKKAPIIFLFSGQGSQYINMGIDLYSSEPLFRKEADECFELLKKISEYNFKEIMFPTIDRELSKMMIDQIDVSPVVTFVLEYSLTKLLLSWGIEPYAMIGHSIGEYTASCFSGVLNLEDTLGLIYFRGQLMKKLPAGMMLNIPLNCDEIRPYLNDNISLAADHGESCIISGPLIQITKIEKELQQKKIICQRLKIEVAGHSFAMEAIKSDFKEKLNTLNFNIPKIPYLSNVTGDWITIEEAISSDYWVRQMRETVQFGKSLEKILKIENAIFCEVGPGNALSTIVQHNLKDKSKNLIINTLKLQNQQYSDTHYLLTRIGYLWLNGVSINWKTYYNDEKRKKISLPGYSFKKTLYSFDEILINKILQNVDQLEIKDDEHFKQDIDGWLYLPSWKPSVINNLNSIEKNLKSVCLLFVNDYSICLKLIDSLRKVYENLIIVREGEVFSVNENLEFTIVPGKEEDFILLVKYLKEHNLIPNSIIHLWNIYTLETEVKASEVLAKTQNYGFYSLLFLVKTLASHSITSNISLHVISNQMQGISGNTLIYPEKATSLGVIRTIPKELSNFYCKSIDINQIIIEERKELQLVNSLVKEILSNTQDRIICYKNNIRYTLEYEQIKIDTPEIQNLNLKKNGVYLITGGLGGLGLEIGEHLAKLVGARLILLSKSSFPFEEEWDEVLKDDDKIKKFGEKIKKLKYIKSLGGDIFIAKADISDYENTKCELLKGIKYFGNFDGVIHCAGIPGGGIIQLKTRDQVEEVFAPKIYGTIVINQLIQDLKLELDFVLLFSSLNAILPNVGTLDYCAANTFMDAFAHYKNSIGNINYISINWDAWQKVGGAVETVKQLFHFAENKIKVCNKLKHPLFVEHIYLTDENVFISKLEPGKIWVLDEHRIFGKATMPGTGYIEMVYTAFGIIQGELPIEIRNMHIFKAMTFENEESKEVHTVFKKKGDIYQFRILSRLKKEEDNWIEHCAGEISKLKLEIETDLLVNFRNEKTVLQEGSFKDYEYDNGSVIFGERWKNKVLRREIGKNISISNIAIENKYYRDLEIYSLHPALFDVALSPVLSSGFFLPFSYQRIVIYKNIGRTFQSSAVITENNSDFVNYNFVLSEISGNKIIEIENYKLIRKDINFNKQIDVYFNRQHNINSDFVNYISPDIENKRIDEKVKEYLKDAIDPFDGKEVFIQILSCNIPQVVVSTKNLKKRIIEGEKEKFFESNSILDTNKQIEFRIKPELSTNYVAARNRTEEQLLKIWQEYFAYENIGIYDDFFELGGNSVKAILILNKLREVKKVNITISEFFKNPNIKNIAELISDNKKVDFVNTSDLIVPVEKKEYYLASSIQKRLYIIQQINKLSTAYNIPQIILLDNSLEFNTIENIFYKLVKKHDCLRTSFKLNNSELYQIINEEFEFSIQYKEADEYNVSTIIKDLINSFDLTKAPLIKVAYIKLDSGKTLLFIDLHHIIADFMSFDILKKDFIKLYKEEKLDPNLLQFKDYTEWLQRPSHIEKLKKQEAFWLRQFMKKIPVLNMPYDNIIKGDHSGKEEIYYFKINTIETKAIINIAKNQDLTLFMLMIAIYNIFIAKICKQNDITVGITVFDRNNKDLEKVIGMFSNTIVFRNFPSDDKKFSLFLKEIKSKTIETLEYQNYQIDLLIEKLGLVNRDGKNPITNIGFGFYDVQEDSDQILKNIDDQTILAKLDLLNAKADLLLDVYFNGNEFGLYFRYSNQFFNKETIQSFSEYFCLITNELIDNQDKMISDISVYNKKIVDDLTNTINDISERTIFTEFNLD